MKSLKAFNIGEIRKLLSFKVPHFVDARKTWSYIWSIFTSIDAEHVQVQQC